MSDEKKYALLIDAENVSSKYIGIVTKEAQSLGNITIRRIYGDWTLSSRNSWRDSLLENSLIPIQQYSYTVGKNSSDSAMIIDAMDILYTDNVDGFIIVSSDSDFTRLATRLRESGKRVIGMGESKTPVPFRKACDIFTELELLLEDSVQGNAVRNVDEGRNVRRNNSSANVSSVPVTKSQIEEAVAKIITENKNDDKETGLGEVGSRLVKLYPDFDVRRYGYSLLSKFLETLPRLKLNQAGTQVTVMFNEDKSKKEQVEEFILREIKAAGAQGISLGVLGNKIRSEFRDFKVRDYGYSQFKQYIRSFEHVSVKEDEEQNRAVYEK